MQRRGIGADRVGGAGKKKRNRLSNLLDYLARDPIAEAIDTRLQNIFDEGMDDDESRAFVLKQLKTGRTVKDSFVSNINQCINYFSRVKIRSEIEVKTIIDMTCDDETFPYGVSFIVQHPRLMLFAMNYIIENSNCSFNFRIDFFNRFFPAETFDGSALDQQLRKPIERQLIHNLNSRLSFTFIHHAGEYLLKMISLEKVYLPVPLLDALFESIKIFLNDRDVYNMSTVHENIEYVFNLCDKIDQGMMAETYRARYFELLLLLYDMGKYEVYDVFIQYVNNLVLRRGTFPKFLLPGKRAKNFKDCLRKLAKEECEFFIRAGVKNHLDKEETDCPLVSHAKLESPFVQAMRVMPIKPIFHGEIAMPEVEWSRFKARALHPESKAVLCEWILFYANQWREAADGFKLAIEERIRNFFYFLSQDVSTDYSLRYKNELLKKVWQHLPCELQNILDPAAKINGEILKNLPDVPEKSVISSEEVMALQDSLLEIAKHKSRPGESSDARVNARYRIMLVANKILTEDNKRILFHVLANCYCLLGHSEKIFHELFGVKPGVAKDQVKYAIIEWSCLLHRESYGALHPDLIFEVVDFDYLRSQDFFKVTSAAIWDQLGRVISQKIESDSIKFFKAHYAFDLRFFHEAGRFKEKTDVDVAFIRFLEEHKGALSNLSNVSLYLDEFLQRHILIELHGQYLSWVVPQALEARLVMSLNSLAGKGAFNLAFVFASLLDRVVPEETRLHLSNVLLDLHETAAFFTNFEIAMNRVMQPEMLAQEKSFSEALCHNFFHGYLYALYAKDYFKMRSNKSLSASDKQKGKDISYTRPDLLCISSDQQHAVIFEFKFSKDSSMRTANSPVAAITQIEKQYLAHGTYWQHAAKVGSHRNQVQSVIAVGVEFYLHEGRYRLNFAVNCFQRAITGFRSMTSALTFSKLRHLRSDFQGNIHDADHVATQIQAALCELSSHNFPTQRSEFFESFVLGLFSGLSLSRFEKYPAGCEGYFLEFNSRALAICVISAMAAEVNEKIRIAADAWCLQLLAQGVSEGFSCYVMAMSNPGRGQGSVVVGVFTLQKEPRICFYYPEKIHRVALTSVVQSTAPVSFASAAGRDSFFSPEKKLKLGSSSAAGAGAGSSSGADKDEEIEFLYSRFSEKK